MSKNPTFSGHASDLPYVRIRRRAPFFSLFTGFIYKGVRMSIQSEQFTKNSLKKLLFVAGSGLFAFSAAAALTYGYFHGQSYRLERSQWVALQALAVSEDYEACRSQGNALPSQSRFYSEAQSLVQQCSMGLARQQANNQDLTAAITTALSITAPDEALQSEAESLVTQWSGQVVKRGEQLLQAGELDQAIAVLQELPPELPTAGSVESTIQGWQRQWDQSEATIQTASELLDSGQWLAAKNELAGVASITYWQQQKEPLLEQAEAGIAEVARFEAEQARQRAIAAAPRYTFQPPSPGQPATAQAPVTAYLPPEAAAPSLSSFDRRVESLYNSYVAQGQNSWDAWIQACQASGGYVVDQGPQAGCLP